jgi:hypothetical protein
VTSTSDGFSDWKKTLHVRGIKVRCRVSCARAGPSLVNTRLVRRHREQPQSVLSYVQHTAAHATNKSNERTDANLLSSGQTIAGRYRRLFLASVAELQKPATSKIRAGQCRATDMAPTRAQQPPIAGKTRRIQASSTPSQKIAQRDDAGVFRDNGFATPAAKRRPRQT